MRFIGFGKIVYISHKYYAIQFGRENIILILTITQNLILLLNSDDNKF